MRKTARGWEFPILQKTLVSLIFFSVTLLGLPLHGISQGDSSRFSGQQIFQGLYFGVGSVAKLFPDIWASDEATLPLDTKEKVLEWDNLKTQIVSQVDQIDSTFFGRFGVEMQSGDHIRVQDACLNPVTKPQPLYRIWA